MATPNRNREDTIKRLMQLLSMGYSDVECILNQESWRYALWMFSKIPFKKAGWCSAIIKKKLPNIEIYVDDMAKAIVEYLRARDMFTEENFIRYMVVALEQTVLHELTHLLADEWDDQKVENILAELFSEGFMGWTFISCPKLENKPVTWVQCLSCEDDEKSAVCPLHKIRIDAFPRQYKENEFHVTELLSPRASFFERTISYTKSWDSYWSLFFGRAVGFYVASLYAKHMVEVKLEKDFGDFKVVGSADLIDEEDGSILEIKCYHSLRHIIKKGCADPRHEFQARAYWTLLKTDERNKWMASKIKKIRIVYFGRTGDIQYREFEVPKEEVDLEKPARMLYDALKTGEPPKEHCPDWLCEYEPEQIKAECKRRW